MKKWIVEDSIELYNINGWGNGYFDINKDGHFEVKPRKNCASVDLYNLVKELDDMDLSTPVLLRFPDILDDRIETLNNCFEIAKKEYEFNAEYYSVYPIKVNQNKNVVDEIVHYGAKYNIGLEAGSKPELHAVLAYTHNPDSLVVCNGYKDEEFIELALLAHKMGRKVFIVVEKMSELRRIKSIADKLDIKPNIGIRIKLASAGSGKWEESGGDKSKFGLSASELLLAIDFAKENNLLDCIRLIHFHIGSQITNIRNFKYALREAAQFYVQMRKMGCAIDFCDIGGGLGIDYDGTRTSTTSSVNYFVQEYVNDFVATFAEAANKNNEPHPNIISESGRALTGHHTMIVFDVMEKSNVTVLEDEFELLDRDHDLTKEMYNIWDNLSSKNMRESWHDAQQIRVEALDLFSLGLIDLETRAYIERIFWTIAKEVHILSKDMRHLPDELRALPRMLADKYFCNFSLFQSLPDSWAIDQLFPIVPIHRLNEKPERLATLQDITCDSDGRIDIFTTGREQSHLLPVHKLNDDETYYIGIFLTGAYQEILGDMHNLFGDMNTVHIKVNEDSYNIEKTVDGETVSDMLQYVQYDSKKLVRAMELWVKQSQAAGKISAKEGRMFLTNYRSGLYSYTYFENEF